MSILIKTVERANPQNREEKKFYAAVASRDVIELDDLAEIITHYSSLSKGDIYSVLVNLVETVPNQLLDGKVVRLGKLGSMLLNVKSIGMDTAEEVTGDTVKSVHIVYRPTAEVKHDLENFSIRTS